MEPALSILCEQFAKAMRDYPLNRWLIEQKTFWLIAGDGLSEKLGAYSDYRKRALEPLSRI